jgi:lysozyme
MTFTYRGIHGPDVSLYQDPPATPQHIDFEKMRAAGASFVILRAGQNSWIDPSFAFNYKAAKAAGLPRGIYWFYDSRSTPESQATLCLSLASGDPPELGFWLDLEESYNGPYKGWQNWKKCLTAFKAKTLDIGIYTAPYYWMMHRPTGEGDLYFFASFPLWIANYGVSEPLVPGPWGFALLWQIGTPAVGLEYGTESLEIDMNHFNGTPEAFRAYFGLTTTLPPPSGETEQTMKGTVKTFTNIRLDRNKNSADMGDLLAGDTVTWQEEYAGTDGLTWIKIVTATHNGVTIKCVDGADAGGRYCWANNVAEDPEPPAPEPVELPEYVTLHYAGGVTRKYVPE